MVASDAEFGAAGETIEHLAHHETLAVERGWPVGKDQELHDFARRNARASSQVP